MTRIPFPDLDKAPAEVREMLSRLPAPVGIFNMMAHAETVLKPLMKLGGTFLGKLELDPLLRELVILHAVNIEGGEYEWVQHAPVVLALGGSQAQVDALRAGDDQAACFSDAQKAVLRFTREVVVDVGASKEALAEAKKHLSEREIVEVILVAGFYIMLARLTETLDIPNDPPMGDKLVRQIEARVAGKKKE
ncbi:MAG: carboxymuconolactone decarboxylase family protein [Hyphomicrobiaceae bacterium]